MMQSSTRRRRSSISEPSHKHSGRVSHICQEGNKVRARQGRDYGTYSVPPVARIRPHHFIEKEEQVHCRTERGPQALPGIVKNESSIIQRVWLGASLVNFISPSRRERKQSMKQALKRELQLAALKSPSVSKGWVPCV